MHFSLPKIRTARRHSQHGFALVTTLMMMVLLAIVAVSLLSLASISLRSTGVGSHAAEARANARLAMMLALGELQKEIGPDQRITAAARVLDEQIDTPIADGIAHPLWLGAWNSWDQWLNASGIRGTYTKGRKSAFRRWLVSNPDPSATSAMAAASTAGQNLVEMVGLGSLGKSAGAAMRVSVPKVPLKEGGFAWWVGGENQKAYVTASPAPANRSDQLARLSAWPQSGHDKLEGLGSLPTSVSVLAKTITLPTLGATQQDAAVRDRLQSHFHDLTTESAGLLANVREGGLKKDLNLLLERDRLPKPFGDFNRSNPNGSIVSIRDRETDIPDPIFAPNFASWYKLHQYYSLYKGQGDETSADSVPLPFKRGIWGNGAPNANFNWDRGNFDQFGWGRTPILSRIKMVFSTRRVASRTPGKFDYRLGVNPVVVIWNPYNVTLHAGRLFIEIGPGAIEYKTYVEPVPETGNLGLS